MILIHINILVMCIKDFDIEAFRKKNGLDNISLTRFDEDEINPNHTYKVEGFPFETFTGSYILEHNLYSKVLRDNDNPQHGGHHFEITEEGKWIKVKNCN